MDAQAPASFRPPRVTRESQGVRAFVDYNWYYLDMYEQLKTVRKVFLTPCAATKPINTSTLHRTIYQRYAKKYGQGRAVLVVSEPVVLIRYEDLSNEAFFYDFPPKLLGKHAREVFVKRLHTLLWGKDVVGCLPKHHAGLIDEAIAPGWGKNYWDGDLYTMMAKAGRLKC